jgi:hypothetical protein
LADFAFTVVILSKKNLNHPKPHLTKSEAVLGGFNIAVFNKLLWYHERDVLGKPRPVWYQTVCLILTGVRIVKAPGYEIQTKNAVLLEATRTIFSNQQTGYLNNDNEPDSPNKIIEIFKSSTDRTT